MTYPTPPIPPSRRTPTSGSPLFRDEAHPVLVGIAVLAGILLWIVFLTVIPKLV